MHFTCVFETNEVYSENVVLLWDAETQSSIKSQSLLIICNQLHPHSTALTPNTHTQHQIQMIIIIIATEKKILNKKSCINSTVMENLMLQHKENVSPNIPHIKNFK